MYTAFVHVCSPLGLYPDFTVFAGTIAQSSFIGLPLHLSVAEYSDLRRPGRAPDADILWASLLITRKRFPAFAFSERHRLATLVFNTFIRPELPALLSHAKAVFKGSKKVPIYYPDQSVGRSDRDGPGWNEREYLNISGDKKLSLSNHVEKWADSCEFSWHKPSTSTVKRYFSIFSSSSRFIQIALHYYVNAANLMHFGFIEEAGLNLQLTVDALVHDFMIRNSIGNKSRAVMALQDTVTLPGFHMEFLEELYEARNSYLAHIDTGMFTGEECINDPDAYCYEHYESVSWLITRYIQYTRSIHSRTDR